MEIKRKQRARMVATLQQESLMNVGQSQTSQSTSQSKGGWVATEDTTPKDKPGSATLPFELFTLALQRKLKLYQVKPRSRGR